MDLIGKRGRAGTLIFLMSIFLGVLLMFGCSTNEEKQSEFLNARFMDLQLPSTPNYYLSCPKGYCNVVAHQESPAFNCDVIQLYTAWQQMIEKQPRVALLKSDLQHFKFVYRQRTRWLRFPDFITVVLLPIDSTHSTIAIYSRARYGYSDFGVNRKRVQDWLGGLSAACVVRPNK